MKLRLSRRILISWGVIFIAVSMKKYGSRQRQLIAKYPILWVYVGLVEVIILVTRISEKMNLVFFIQPIFLISCVMIGYRVATYMC